jgi:hypothetical protein
MKFVSPGLLAAMGNRLTAGRDFTWTETVQHLPVAMVSENLARELWQEPRLALGKQIRENLTGPWREVIGVVADEHSDGMQANPPAAAWYPLFMNDFEGNSLNVRRTTSYIVRSGRAASPALLTDVRNAVWALNPNLPVANVRTLGQIYERSMARTSFTLVMLAIAGAMALLIGLVGIYGVISYLAAQRTREIGIRLALGARQTELARMFVTEGVRLGVIGVGFGLGAAFAVSRLLQTLLFGVSALDPLTWAAMSAGLITAAAIASYVPAMRAARIDPSTALRD